jgi:transcriptional regulator with XRE-family HTH domain
MAPPDPWLVLRDLGRRIAELRASRGLTQEGFAEVADVTVQYAQRVEAGKENLTVRSLVRIAGLLAVTVADLFATPVSRESRPGRPRLGQSRLDRDSAHVEGPAPNPSVRHARPARRSTSTAARARKVVRR